MARTVASVPVPTVLAGDFNASLDHHPFVALLGTDFRDAAEQTGDAWRPTWTNGRWAALTLDHVLVTDTIAIRDTTMEHLPGSDHDLFITTLQLPR